MLLELLKKINELKRTPRMGWLESGIEQSEAEDVAQHSFEVSTITLLLADSIDEEVDTCRALRMAIIHDWAEAITGDFSLDVSKGLGVGVKENIEETVIDTLLLKEIDDGEKYLKAWQEYSDLETKESRLVRVADRLSILVEASGLFQEGERSEKLEEIWQTTRKELEDYTEEFPALENLLRELNNDFPSEK